MDVKKDSTSSETAAQPKRLSLRRERVRTLGLRTGIRTGSCTDSGICAVGYGSGCGGKGSKPRTHVLPE